MNGYAERVCFDPGGKLLIRGVFELYAAMGKFYLSFDEFVHCAFIMLLQLKLGHHFRRVEMMLFDPGGEVAVQNMQSIKVVDSREVLALIKLHKSEEFQAKLMWGFEGSVRLLESTKCLYFGSQALVFDPGIILEGERKSKTRIASIICGRDYQLFVFDSGIIFNDEWEIETKIASMFCDTFKKWNYPYSAEACDVDFTKSSCAMCLTNGGELLGEVATGELDSGQCTSLIFALDPGGGFSKFNGEVQCARSSSGYAMCLPNTVEFVPITNPHFDWSAKGKEDDAEFMLKIEKISELQLLQLGFLINTLPIHLHKLLGFLEIIHSDALVKIRLLVGAMIVKRDYILAYLLLALSFISMIVKISAAKVMMKQCCELSFEVLPSILVNQKIASFGYELKVTSSIIKELPCVREATATIFDSSIGIMVIFVIDPGGVCLELINPLQHSMHWNYNSKLSLFV